MLKARMNSPVVVIPEAMKALLALSEATKGAGLPPGLLELVHLRASQLNGCSVCVDMHPRIARKHGETDERLFTVAAWRDAPYFTDAERAALALTESLTRLGEVGDPVPDAVWDAAARHFDEKALAALVLSIGQINLWNRVNLATRQVAGQAWK
jgi:AhpD family alkylhydroperoxidase